MARILEQDGYVKRTFPRFSSCNGRALRRTLRDFAVEETAIAMTEYLVLLGLLIGGAIGAIIYVAQELGFAFISWGSFWNSL